jgi:3-oxoacyl-[acyl-carrier-protein] synthase II
MDRRIVITGIGLLTPIGIGKNAFWKAVVNGESKIRDVRDNHTKTLKTRLGCKIDSLKVDEILGGNTDREMLGKAGRLSQAAAKLALADAGLEDSTMVPDRTGVSMGTTMAESEAVEKATMNGLFLKNKFLCTPTQMHQCCPLNIPMGIAEAFGFEGPTMFINAACAAGNYAVGHAYDLIRTNRADVMLAGGTDPFSMALHLGFSRMKLVATDLCRPFDKNRNGLLVGEGAAAVVLEEYHKASTRGARIYAELLGYGLSSDAYHMSTPEPEGRGMSVAMKRALQHANARPEDIDYISAHGTGTKTNDRIETMAIRDVFGPSAKKTPISSIKSMIGHTMGAAGAIELATCALVIKHGVAPPTINYKSPDPLCNLDYIPNSAREINAVKVVTNSYGFFGNNASIVIGAC